MKSLHQAILENVLIKSSRLSSVLKKIVPRGRPENTWSADKQNRHRHIDFSKVVDVYNTNTFFHTVFQ